MTVQYDSQIREYGSGEVVDPGVYIDVETGAIVQVRERDELPEEVRVVRVRRKYRRLDGWSPAGN